MLDLYSKEKYAKMGFAHEIPGGAISSIDYSIISGAISGLVTGVVEKLISGVTGDFYPRSNPSGFITGGDFYPRSNPSGFITGVDLSNLYPRSNPSGFITGVDLSNLYPRSNPSGFITGVSIPTPPSPGTYVLGSINGAIQWIATEVCPTP